MLGPESSSSLRLCRPVLQVSNLITKKEGSRRKDSKTLIKRVRVERRCSRCSETRHNSYTCKVEIEDVNYRGATKYFYSIAYSILI